MPLSVRTLYDLLEIAPSVSEQVAVQRKMSWLHSSAFSASKAHSLSFAEEFFYELSDIGHLELRLQLLIFERKFESALGDRYHEVAVLLEALRAAEGSRAMDGLLAVVLSFGNFMNVEVERKGKAQPLGVGGFELEWLRRLSRVTSNDGCCSMLSFVLDFCRSHSQWRHCLAVPEELAFCSLASSMKLRPLEMRRKVLLIVEELHKFGRSLRKFRKAAIAQTAASGDGRGRGHGHRPQPLHLHRHGHEAPYRRVDDDRFEHYMMEFVRRGQLSCESLLDLHREAVSLAQNVAQQFHYDLDAERIEDVVSSNCRSDPSCVRSEPWAPLQFE